MVGNIGHKDVPRIQLVVGRSAHLIKIFRLNIFKSECSEKQAGECYGTWRQPIPNMLHSGKKKIKKKEEHIGYTSQIFVSSINFFGVPLYG